MGIPYALAGFDLTVVVDSWVGTGVTAGLFVVRRSGADLSAQSAAELPSLARSRGSAPLASSTIASSSRPFPAATISGDAPAGDTISRVASEACNSIVMTGALDVEQPAIMLDFPARSKRRPLAPRHDRAQITNPHELINVDPVGDDLADYCQQVGC